MPSKQAVAAFKALFQTHQGIVLSDKDAQQKATALLRLYRAVYTPTMKMNPDEKASQSSINSR